MSLYLPISGLKFLGMKDFTLIKFYQLKAGKADLFEFHFILTTRLFSKIMAFSNQICRDNEVHGANSHAQLSQVNIRDQFCLKLCKSNFWWAKQNRILPKEYLARFLILTKSVTCTFYGVSIQELHPLLQQ